MKMNRQPIDEAKAKLLDEARANGYALPCRPAARTAGKELVRAGVLEPNGCLGYRLTDREGETS